MDDYKIDIKLLTGRRTQKNHPNKLFPQRSKHKNIQNKSKLIIDKLQLVQNQRENPIHFLERIKQNHHQIQHKLEEAHQTNRKWLSYNSPFSTPHNKQTNIIIKQSTQQIKQQPITSKNKQNIFLQTIYTKKRQLNAIKVYNHIHNSQLISNKKFQQPQYIDFIQQAVSKSTRSKEIHGLSELKTSRKKLATVVNKKDCNLGQPNQSQAKQYTNYALSQNRRQILNLEDWIKTKLQTYDKSQSSGESMFIQRINFLNMAFGQVTSVIGKFSVQTKHLSEYLHKKYYEYYNFLIQRMMQQNKNIKSQIKSVQNKLCTTINYYQQKLQKLKQQNDQKSLKIIKTFQKCIQVKKRLQIENKQLKKSINHQKKKVKLIQEGLIKVITLFLALGHKNIKQMTFNSDLEQKQIQKNSILSKSKKNIMTEEQQQMERRKQIFNQWCGYLVKMIHRIVMKDSSQNKNNYLKSQLFKDHAFQIIKKYMVENDDSLSMADAQKLLKNFLNSQQLQLKLKKQLQTCSLLQKQQKERKIRQFEQMNRKFQSMYNQISYQLPSFEQVYNKILLNDIEVQVDIKSQTQNMITQTYIQTQQIGILAVPRCRNKQIDVSSHFRQKLSIQSELFSYAEVYKVKKQKIVKKIQILASQKENTQENQKQYEEGNTKQLFIRKQSHQSQGSQINGYNLDFNLNNFNNKRLNIDNIVELTQKTNELTRQIGINTLISNLNKKKTVQFSIPAQQQNQKPQQNQEQQNHKDQLNSQTKLIDSVKQFLQLQQDAQSVNNSNSSQKNKPFLRGRRKNGFIITGDKKKTHLSHRYILSKTQISIGSVVSINTDHESSVQQQSQMIKRKPSVGLQHQQDNRTSIQKTIPENRKDTIKNKTIITNNFQQRLAMNRSFFNLSNIEYASKADADTNRIKDHAVRVPKKRTIRERFMIDPYDLHFEIAFKNQQKIKFMSAIALWQPKLTVQMRKIRNRINNIKCLAQVSTKTMNIMKGYFIHILNPIIKDYIKLFCQEINVQPNLDSKDNSMNSSLKGFKKQIAQKQLYQTFPSSSAQKNKKASGTFLTYYHKLSPFLYNIINYTHYHQNKTSTDNQIYFSGMKTLKNQNTKMQIYNLLLEAGCVEFDIFIKSIYYFNLTVSGNFNYDPEISYFIVQTNLTEILQGYMQSSQIDHVMEQVKNSILTVNKMSSTGNSFSRRGSTTRTEFKRDNRDSIKIPHKKSLNQNSKISFFQLLKIVYSNLKQKQQTQQKKYSLIKQIISRNSQCTYYQDMVHFLQCLPIQSNKKKKILHECLKRTIYWYKSQAVIPNDILYFILDKYELYSSSSDNINSNTNVIKQYIVNRCELYFKATLHKVIKNPQWVINSTYVLSYRIPKLFHRLLYQIRSSRNHKQKKLVLCLLTQIFCNLIDNQMDKRFIPILLNGLISIPLV